VVSRRFAIYILLHITGSNALIPASKAFVGLARRVTLITTLGEPLQIMTDLSFASVVTTTSLLETVPSFTRGCTPARSCHPLPLRDDLQQAETKLNV
jgi:hypothetical protein